MCSPTWWTPRQTALAVNALAAGRLPPLREDERTVLASEVAGALFRAWGGAAGRETRPSACDLQLTRFGLTARDGEIVAACADYAAAALDRGGTRQRPRGLAAPPLRFSTRNSAPYRIGF